MRVNHSSNAVQGGEASGVKQAGRAATTQETKKIEHPSSADVEKTTSRGVNTEISAKSKEFAQAKAAASDAPDIRQDRVAELKRKIEGGHYKVDADAIADRMVDEHLKMSGIG